MPMLPPHRQVSALAAAIGRYRGLVAAGWPRPGFDHTLRRGDIDPRVPDLRRRLRAEGYLPADPVTGDGLYDDVLAAAVREFQRHHGLSDDGVIGNATATALDAPPEYWLDKLVLNLARFDRFPAVPGDPYILVNIADQQLILVSSGEVALMSRVIVGKPATPTPVLDSRIDSVVLNPPWTVPRTIAVAEILPELRRDPGYLRRHDTVILGRDEDPYGLLIDWRRISPRSFNFEFQQRPGGDNPLGRIKFDFPNSYSVYLHDTPNKSAFDRMRRTLSHGCIRVERARELALRLLSAQDWDRAGIEAAVADGATQTVRLDRAVPLYVSYFTAFAVSDGSIRFRDDVYQWDETVPAAERIRRPPVPDVQATAGFVSPMLNPPPGIRRACGNAA
jgi:murein L,D-transpeptidase YcbB/YkuD